MEIKKKPLFNELGDTCRAKKKRLNENIKNYNKNYADLYS